MTNILKKSFSFKNMSLRTEKVNNIDVLPLPKPKSKKIVRSSIFKSPFTTTALISKRESGKTTTLAAIIKDTIEFFPMRKRGSDSKPSKKCLFGDECSDPNKIEYYRPITVFIFCGSIHTDSNYKTIIDMLNEMRVDSYVTSISTMDQENTKLNLIGRLIQWLQKKCNSDNSDDDDDDDYVLPENLDPKEANKFNMPHVKNGSDVLIIFDDLSSEIRNNPKIRTLLKLSRNLRCVNVIISTQTAKDLTPDSLQQIDNLLLWTKVNDENLKHLHESCSIGIPYIEFVRIYKDATREPFSFLYCDLRRDKFYRKFNDLYLLNLS